MRRLLAVLVPVLALAAIVAISMMSSNELAAPRDTLEEVAGTVVLSGAPLPPLPAGAQPAILTGSGLQAPALLMRDREDAEVSVGSGAGVAQVLVFLAHWCPACQQELPSLAAVVGSDGVPPGVELVAVLTGMDPTRPNWPPYAWLDREGFIAGPAGEGLVRVVRDDTDGLAMSAFGLSSYPGWAVVSPSGEVAARFSGVIDREGITTVLDEASRLG